MITISNITYSYNSKKDVIKNISFSLNSGEFLSIIGPNGSGKTTLLKAVSRILEPEGKVTIDNKNISEMKRRDIAKKISYFSQIKGGISDLTVYDTVMLGRYPYFNGILSKPTENDLNIVKDTLKQVELFDLKDTFVSKLSGGQMQRVFLAQIIAQDTKVILLDEPTNHLDLKHQVELLEFIKKFAVEKQKIIIAVFHDLTIAKQYSDKILLLDNGEIDSFSNSKDVFYSESINRIYGLNIRNYMVKGYKEWTL